MIVDLIWGKYDCMLSLCTCSDLYCRWQGHKMFFFFFFDSRPNCDYAQSSRCWNFLVIPICNTSQPTGYLSIIWPTPSSLFPWTCFVHIQGSNNKILTWWVWVFQPINDHLIFVSHVSLRLDFPRWESRFISFRHYSWIDWRSVWRDQEASVRSVISAGLTSTDYCCLFFRSHSSTVCGIGSRRCQH